MLNAIDGADDIYFDVVSQTRIDRWSHGRVVLIGDAAGCISLLGGEGTGLVMTVAYALAGEPHRAGDDCQQAFQAYETLMHPFVESKQAGGQRFIEFFATRTKFGLWFRNLATHLMNAKPFVSLFSGEVRDNLGLPEHGIQVFWPFPRLRS